MRKNKELLTIDEETRERILKSSIYSDTEDSLLKILSSVLFSYADFSIIRYRPFLPDIYEVLEQEGEKYDVMVYCLVTYCRLLAEAEEKIERNRRLGSFMPPGKPFMLTEEERQISESTIFRTTKAIKHGSILYATSEATEIHKEIRIPSTTASQILNNAMAEYSATQILNRVLNDTKATREPMIGGNRLSNKKTCERFESELNENVLYLYIQIVVSEQLSATGNLAMRPVELFACAMELIDDIKEKSKLKFPKPARTILCDIFSKVITETKPSNGSGYGDRQVEIYNEKIGDETEVAKNIKVLIGISAYLILHYAGVEKYQRYADDLSEFCRGLNQNFADSILRMSAKGGWATDNVIEEVRGASRDYVEGNSPLSHYLLTGVKDTADAETLSDDESKNKLSPEFVERAFLPLKEARCKEGSPVINAEPFKIVIQNFRNWYNEGHNLNIERIVTKGTISGLIEICITIKNNIDGKNHKLTFKDFESFLKLQFNAFKNRKKPFLTH